MTQLHHYQPYTSIRLTTQNNIDEILNDILETDFNFKPRIINKPVIIYGAGSLGIMTKDFLNYLNITLLYVIDKNSSKYTNDEMWKDIQVKSPDIVTNYDKNNCLLILSIVTIPIIDLIDQLKEDGWKDIELFYDVSEAYTDKYPLQNGWFINKLNSNEMDLIKKIYFTLKDKISQAHYLQFIAWRKLRVELNFKDIDINVNNRFFIPEVTKSLTEHEIFVDCGAHHGFVIDKFIDITYNNYNKIYAIEPDEINYEIIFKKYQSNTKIHFINKALNDVEGSFNFYQGFDYASKLSPNGKSKKKSITLDSLGIEATFIKIHLEGGELLALKGSLITIKNNRPIIAVTLYHNYDGLWKIPSFIIENCNNYSFYMRLHSWAGTGAVFYAIPN